MDKILIFDLSLFLIISLVITIFLYRNKKNLKREGIIFLYKTKLGINFMERFVKKNENFLKKLKYVIIPIAFILMLFVSYLFALTAYQYVFKPKETKEITQGATPIAPVIPYFPKIFGLDKYFPNFYFIYFIVIFSILAVFHEFAHGIFMKLYNVRIKSTGFLFLGPILGAFVEQDDKIFRKKKNSEQMTVLGAGVFANFLLAVVFFIFLLLFFFSVYKPSGYVFPQYARTEINVSSIVNISNYSSNFIEIKTIENKSYFISVSSYEKIKDNLENYEILPVLITSPALLNNVSGAISEIDGVKIKNVEDFVEVMKTKKPEQKILLKTIDLKTEQEKVYEIILDKHPQNESLAFLGVSVMPIVLKPSSPLQKIIFKIRNPFVYYKTLMNKDIAEFIYYFIWWAMLLNFFVAIFNMLPFGIFDGGRFSYLLILSLVKSEKKAEKIYKIFSSLIVLFFVSIIVGWIFAKIIF